MNARKKSWEEGVIFEPSVKAELFWGKKLSKSSQGEEKKNFFFPSKSVQEVESSFVWLQQRFRSGSNEELAGKVSKS